MASGFFEIVIDEDAFESSDFDGRDEVEDPVSDVLKKSALGRVSGGGSGSGYVVIDVDVFDGTRLDEAVAVVVGVLRELKVPDRTVIECHDPIEKTVEIWS